MCAEYNNNFKHRYGDQSKVKYTVYDNDLKFKKMRDINPKQAKWETSDMRDHDTIEYRLEECVKNNFTSLDLSHLELTDLPHDHLSNWKYVDKIKNIIHLFINNNNIKSCDVRMFKNLQVLDISHNNLTNVKLPQFLIEFVCNNNNLLMLPMHDNIHRLDCSNNKLTEIPAFSQIKDLLCSNNMIKILKKFKNINRIVCKNNPLTWIDDQPAITQFDCSGTKLSGKINNMNKLKHLICNNTKINNIDNLINLESLEMSYSDITTIPYLNNLKHLIYTKKSDIYLSSKYKIKHHTLEHNTSYVNFA